MEGRCREEWELRAQRGDLAHLVDCADAMQGWPIGGGLAPVTACGMRPVEILTLLEEEVEYESGAAGNAVHERLLLPRRPQADPM